MVSAEVKRIEDIDFSEIKDIALLKYYLGYVEGLKNNATEQDREHLKSLAESIEIFIHVAVAQKSKTLHYIDLFCRYFTVIAIFNFIIYELTK